MSERVSPSFSQHICRHSSNTAARVKVRFIAYFFFGLSCLVFFQDAQPQAYIFRFPSVRPLAFFRHKPAHKGQSPFLGHPCHRLVARCVSTDIQLLRPAKQVRWLLCCGQIRVKGLKVASSFVVCMKREGLFDDQKCNRNSEKKHG